MSAIQTIDPSSGSVQPPRHVSISTISELNRAGERENYPWLNTVDEMRIVLFEMPQGKAGVVLGSGSKSEEWKNRGWYTLDNDPNSGADAIYDANEIAQIIKPDSLDYLYSECITMDTLGIRGVSPARLLNQANIVLKDGGILAIKTANIRDR